MKFIREFMLGRYKQYIADQKRLLDLEAKAVDLGRERKSWGHFVGGGPRAAPRS